MTKAHPLSEQCTAKAKSTGQRCGRRVIGAGVCVMHGGAAPRVKAKRLARVALGEQLAASPRRSAGDVLLEALHLADTLSKRALSEVEAGAVTPRRLREVVDASARAGALARSVLSAEAEAVRAGSAGELQAKYLQAALTWFLDDVGLTNNATAEAALARAVAATASQQWMPLNVAHKARVQRLNEETLEFFERLIRGILAALGLDGREPWPAALVASWLRADDVEEWLVSVAKPPRSWWLALVRRGCAELGLPDPTVPPEILPPLRRELTDGRGA